MSIVLSASRERWVRVLATKEALADALGSIGASVGPRKGPNRRSKGDKEDYVLRRLLVAWKLQDQLSFPVEIRAHRDRKGEPDFVLQSADRCLGVEITEAGEEQYQRWLTETENTKDAGGAVDLPFEASTCRTIAELVRAIASKVEKFEGGHYRAVEACDLVVYDNTAWAGFLDKRQLVEGVRARNDLTGRFRQIHLVFGERVVLDTLGDAQMIDVSRTYEIDYPKWISDQVARLRESAFGQLDRAHLAEELEDLGKTERRALASHVRNLLLHLIKYAFQRKKRSASWESSIANARAEIEDILTESPSLRGEFAAQMRRQYPRARQQAAAETGLKVDAFPMECPYSTQQLLDDSYLPE
jgi:hypothetical protein